MRRTLLLCPLMFLLITVLSCEDENGVSPQDDPPDAPALLSPADGATVSDAVQLSWDGSFSAYEVQLLAAKDDPSSVVWTDTVTGTSAAPASLEREQTYYWRVAGLWRDQRIWSETRMFNVPGSAKAWTRCTFKIEGVATDLRMRTITTYTSYPYRKDTSYSPFSDTLSRSITFEYDSTADNLFTAAIMEGGYNGGDYSSDSWSLRVRFNPDDFTVDSVLYSESHYGSSNHAGFSASSSNSTLIRGGGLAMARTEPGLYRIDASVLENLFTVQRSRSSSMNPQLLPYSSTTSSTLIGYEFVSGAFIELRFQ